MQVWYICEAPYPDVPDAALRRHRSARAVLPASLCDPVRAADIFHEVLDEFLLCDDLGINVVSNEHHAGINCLHSASPLFLGILARQTRKVRILSLGTLITVRDDPLRVAEEYATADVLSRGRLEIGFVKSGGSEMASGDASPLEIEERFWEAIEVIAHALTARDGPVSWEGRHFRHRHMNVWPPSLQRPHPPFWAATGNAETARELGRRGYLHTVFALGHARTAEAWAAYREGAAEAGRVATPDRLSAMAFVHVAETDEQAWAEARELLWFLETGDLTAPQFGPLLPGQGASDRVLAAWRNQSSGEVVGHAGRPAAAPRGLTVEAAIARGSMFAGRPETVLRQIRAFRERTGPFGHLVMMGRSGHMTHAQTEASLKLFAREVMPALPGIAA